MRNFFLFLFIFHLSLSSQASDSLFFAKNYALVNQNFQEGYYEENLELINRLVGEKAFQELNCYQQGQIFHRIGGSYYFLDREKEAIQIYRDSVLTRWENCLEVPQEEKANTINNIGLSYQYLGEYDLAKQYLDEALAIFENTPGYSPFELAKKYHAIGTFYLDIRDFFRSELYYENALNLYRDYPETETRRFDILNYLIILYLDQKEYDKATDYFERALNLYQQFPESISKMKLFNIYLNAGIAQWENGDLDAAMQKSQTALQLVDKNADPNEYATAVELMAMVYDKQGQKLEAIRFLGEAEAFYSQTEDYVGLASTYENMGEIYMELGEISKAENYLLKAFQAILSKETYDEDNTPVIDQIVALDDLHLARLLSLKAKIYKKKYEEDQDLTMLEKSLSLHYKIDTVITKNLLSLEFEGSKLDFLELILTYYGNAIEDALQLFSIKNDREYLSTAYYFSSKTKAIILQNELRNEAALQSIAPPDVLEREQELAQRVYDLQEQLSEDETDNKELLQQYVKAQRELETFISSIEQDEQDYYDAKYAFIKPPDIASIQSLLPRDMAVVEYYEDADTIYSFWITKNDFYQISIANNEALARQIKAFVDLCHSPNVKFSGEPGYFLYQKLLEKGLSRMNENISRLCIIPDGVLHTVSFEALNSGGANIRYLIEDYSISFTYSIGLLSRKKSRTGNQQYVGFSTEYTPDLNQKLYEKKLLTGQARLAQLSLAQEEINRASNIFSGKEFLNQDASLSNFYLHSGDAQIIHLSLHGLVDPDYPLRSCILFDDQEEDFVLSAADLYSHKINADLVVLSACHTASGKIFNGEGVQGMSKAFVLSGAKNILSSLWSASEASSLKIMTAFLQNVKDGEPNDLSLHKAKLNYISTADPSQLHPFYWANFILIGELDQAESALFTPGKIFIILSLLFAAGLFFYFRK